jgi:putative ABC transport system permease protein
LGVVAGTIIFRFILAFALSIGLDPVYLKLITALMVLLVVGLPGLKKSS